MTTLEMISEQDNAHMRLLTFVCGECGGPPQLLELTRNGAWQAWSAECCGKKGAGMLTDRQRNFLTIGRPVQIIAIAEKNIL